MKTAFAACSAVLGIAIGLAGGPSRAAAEVRVNGATTVTYGLMRPNKERIEQLAGVTLAILPSSTTRGLTDLAQGRADIAMLAEPLETARERQPEATGNGQDRGACRPARRQRLCPVHRPPEQPGADAGQSSARRPVQREDQELVELGGPSLPVLLVGEPTSSPYKLIAEASRSRTRRSCAWCRTPTRRRSSWCRRRVR